MKKIEINSHAKINLSLDVGPVRPDGMHPVDMIMQQIPLADKVTVEAYASTDQLVIELACDNPEIPTDQRNLAYRAAELMLEALKEKSKAEPLLEDIRESSIIEADVAGEEDDKLAIKINIDKRIPVAAGLAGGSGNAAAVIHALNSILDMNLSLSELCQIGARLGSDVPFCIMGQAALNSSLPDYIKNDPLAKATARARGTGTDLRPCAGLNAHVLLVKPSIGVSTKEVYQGIDNCEIEARPNNDEFEASLNALSVLKDTEPDTDRDDENVFVDCTLSEQELIEIVRRNCINVLENYTLSAYPEVMQIKEQINRACQENDISPISILMSGSGPTVYALFTKESEMKAVSENLKNTLSIGNAVNLETTFIHP